MKSIVDVIGDIRPDLVASGTPGPGHLKIRCPYHGGGQERTPSCSVDLNKPVFFCHGCHESGHVSKLLVTLGLSPDLTRSIVESAPEYVRNADYIEPKNYYQYRGQDPYKCDFILDENLLLDYRLRPLQLVEAGFRDETLRHFEVGFDEERFRITFPLRNLYGDLVGVSGRTVIDEEPRYKIYAKELGIQDYSMDTVKKALLWHGHHVLYRNEPDQLVITEGFKAAMWTWQCGIQDVVALVGNALSRQHRDLIARHQLRVVLFLDNNEAGIIGTLKAAESLQHVSSNPVYVASYPDHRQQPDDLSADEVTQTVGQAVPFARWRQQNHVTIRTYTRRAEARGFLR